MSYYLHCQTSRNRLSILRALLIALASLCLAAHATDPTPTLSDELETDLLDQGLLERCSSASLPEQPVIGEASDNVATQLLLTIERTRAPELREKLIGAYRRYLGCPASVERPKTSGAP